MKLKSLKKNVTEVTIKNVIILFSYSMPVAYNDDDGFHVTDTKHSVTTSKHITQWLDGRSFDTVTQESINELVKPDIMLCE